VRIIAGQLKGRRLNAPTWSGVRPTSDKLRETLFNIVATRVPGARVLDAFAGTGAIGLEALSRGAAQAVFIEQDRRAWRLIQDNAALCGVEDRCVIIRATAERALAARIEGAPFGLIVLDPPYELNPLDRVLRAAMQHLDRDGLMILEHASRRRPPDVAGSRVTRTVRSGDSALSFFEHASDV
jgi:16S rRNA (guanine(966)-N(2))-methyltransferase RsmD